MFDSGIIETLLNVTSNVDLQMNTYLLYLVYNNLIKQLIIQNKQTYHHYRYIDAFRNVHLRCENTPKYSNRIR